jgi:endo-1,4-beta-xylanase
MIAKFIFSLALVCGFVFAGESGEEIRLWPNGAPGSEGEKATEAFESAANSKLPKRFTVVHYPSIYVFLAPKEKANGMAVVVAPGGGHSQLVIDKEGWEIAEWLNGNGIAAFVLKYRLARAPGSHYTVDRDALADAARAVRTVRSRAAEWGVDPARVGFMGFSAGGELTALIETRFDAGAAGAGDPVERASSRPDFAAAIYPGFKPGTITVPKDAPPTFLMWRGDAAVASAGGNLAGPAAGLDGGSEVTEAIKDRPEARPTGVAGAPCRRWGCHPPIRSFGLPGGRHPA